jgi:pilus assembly protein CpaC
MFKHGARRSFILGFGLGGLLAMLSACATAQQFQLPQQIEQPRQTQAPQSQQPLSPPILHRVDSAADRLEMTVNTSRLLTLDSKIPRAQVNNKDIVDLTPLSPDTIQIFAKKTGVTQVNLWDEHDRIHSIDVIVFGDSRELNLVLHAQFPHASIKVRPSANSVILSGYVPEPDQASQIIKIAEDYYPKVISMLKVGGVQQILLHVKVMEVSRTKLRELGVDFWTNNNSFFAVSSISGLITPNAAAASSSAGALPAPAISGTGNDTFRFGILSGQTAFFGFLEAMRQYNLSKVMADPTLVTVSGRPAFFNSGGEFPILIPAGLGTTSVDFKKFGTQVDFVPIVLGNGNIRLEVRPRISFLDPTLSVTTQGITVPGLNVREVDTAVEMKPSQTLAIAGLVQNRLEYTNTGIPYLADMPYVGAAFRKTNEQINEIELLIMVTPELVDPMDPCDVPPCGPGMASASPDDCGLYLKGYSEVPSCGPCGPGGCGMCNAHTDSFGAPTMQGQPHAAANYDGPRTPSDMGSLPMDPNQPILFNSPDRSNRANPQAASFAARSGRGDQSPGFIGPVGYDGQR